MRCRKRLLICFLKRVEQYTTVWLCSQPLREAHKRLSLTTTLRGARQLADRAAPLSTPKFWSAKHDDEMHHTKMGLLGVWPLAFGNQCPRYTNEEPQTEGEELMHCSFARGLRFIGLDSNELISCN